MYVCIYICMYVHMYIYMYVCMYICIYICMYVRMYIYMYVCTYVYIYVCMYVCIYVCTYVYMYVPRCISPDMEYSFNFVWLQGVGENVTKLRMMADRMCGANHFASENLQHNIAKLTSKWAHHVEMVSQRKLILGVAISFYQTIERVCFLMKCVFCFYYIFLIVKPYEQVRKYVYI